MEDDELPNPRARKEGLTDQSGLKSRSRRQNRLLVEDADILDGLLWDEAIKNPNDCFNLWEFRHL